MSTKQLYDSVWITQTIERLAREVIDEFSPAGEIAVVGIKTRGAVLARRLCAKIRSRGRELNSGDLDVTLYRDDINDEAGRKAIYASDISFNLEGKSVLLVDDVLFTGRTIRAAMDELIDFGRPDCIGLLCLVDRGGRELPIQPDFIGDKVELAESDKLRVRMFEIDQIDEVVIEN